ncbi:MAG: hypothetical protein PHI37_00480 [Candidatus Gracilibacteria bacterium]|nr:hypothetical protein [Candidatus Gracilibacteria bacterium]
MSEKDIKNSGVEHINSSNIFDDFTNDTSLINEVERLKEKEKKDVYYYMSLFGAILQNIFVLLLIFAFIGYTYLYIQKNPNISNKAILDPFCFIINKSGIEIPDGTIYCSSITFTKNFYDYKMEQLRNEQSIKIFENITRLYEEGNLLKTKEISFLINKKNEKVNVLKVLEEFDKLKNDFTGIDRRKIQCEDIAINSNDSSLTASCTSYSQGYERGIIGFSGVKNAEQTSGTSISIANSFLNYIDKNSKNFIIEDRQKIFNNTIISGEKNGYTNKTEFELKLKINF